MKVYAPLVTGFVVGRGRIAEEGEDPWKEVGGRQGEGASWGERGEKQEEEEVHQEGNEGGTSSLEVEGSTSASWEGPRAPWEGRNQEVGVRKGLYG